MGKVKEMIWNWLVSFCQKAGFQENWKAMSSTSSWHGFTEVIYKYRVNGWSWILPQRNNGIGGWCLLDDLN